MSNKSAFYEPVRLAWQLFGNPVQLAQIDELILTSLCQPSLLQNDQGELKAYAVLALLQWALSKLENGKTMREKLGAHVLRHRYIKKVKKADYAAQESITEDAVTARVRAAWGRVAQLFEAEMEKNSAEALKRREIAIGLRYADLSAESQTALHYLALFRRPFAKKIIESIPSAPPLPINKLHQYNVVQYQFDTTELAIHPEVVSYVQRLQSLEEQHQWHGKIAPILEQEKFVIEAVYHYQKGGQWQQAATLLLRNEDEIGQTTLPIEDVKKCLERFPQHNLSRDVRAKINLLQGRVSEWELDLLAAENHYRSALRAENSLVKARTLHSLARIFKSKDVEDSIDYCHQCRRQIGGTYDKDGIALWVESALLESILIIEQLPDRLSDAEDLLVELHSHLVQLAPDYPALQSDYYSRWGLFIIGDVNLRFHENKDY